MVGAGAAGLVAAERAAARGRRTLLLEKNRRPGVKILMSGGTRCNLTQATDARGIVAAFGPPGRFLHSALDQLSPQDLVALVEYEGVPTKVEPTGKIFPVSNRATDVLGAFLARLQRTGCVLALGEPLREIARAGEAFQLTTTKRSLTAASLVITTGGKSYPASGTTGDAYAWARRLGHAVIPPRPALVPITSPVPWIHALRGITLPDVSVRLVEMPAGQTARRCLDRRRGSLLFTHFGLSGPAVLNISRGVTARESVERLALELDLLPDTTPEALHEHLRRAQSGSGKTAVSSLLPDALPRRLVDALVAAAGINGATRAAELSKPARLALVAALKGTTVPVGGTLGFAKAEVTAGGVSLDEVDSSSMQSRLVPNLYWAGEVLDLDGPIGGYNFQAAFSTGWLAGLNA